MPIYEICEINGDTCGNTWIASGPFYVELGSIEKAKSIFPTKRAFGRFSIREVKIESPKVIYDRVTGEWRDPYPEALKEYE